MFTLKNLACKGLRYNITWADVDLLSTDPGHSGTYFSEIIVENQAFLLKTMRMKM